MRVFLTLVLAALFAAPVLAAPPRFRSQSQCESGQCQSPGATYYAATQPAQPVPPALAPQSACGQVRDAVVPVRPARLRACAPLFPNLPRNRAK